jgi:hypothetical protein
LIAAELGCTALQKEAMLAHEGVPIVAKIGDRVKTNPSVATQFFADVGELAV